MYRAIGQTTEKSPSDPFVFTSDKGSCLKGTWPSYALICAQVREGSLDPKFAPSPSICGLFMDPARRDAYARLPICWEHGADPEFEDTYKKPIYPWDLECSVAQKDEHLEDIGACLRDPNTSERCALYEHPEVQALLAKGCGADVYKEARARAQSAELRKSMMVAGAALLAGAALYVATRKRRT